MCGKVRRIVVVDGDLVSKAMRCRDNSASFPNRSRVAVKIKLNYLPMSPELENGSSSEPCHSIPPQAQKSLNTWGTLDGFQIRTARVMTKAACSSMHCVLFHFCPCLRCTTLHELDSLDNCPLLIINQWVPMVWPSSAHRFALCAWLTPAL